MRDSYQCLGPENSQRSPGLWQHTAQGHSNLTQPQRKAGGKHLTLPTAISSAGRMHSHVITGKLKVASICVPLKMTFSQQVEA